MQGQQAVAHHLHRRMRRVWQAWGLRVMRSRGKRAATQASGVARLRARQQVRCALGSPLSSSAAPQAVAADWRTFPFRDAVAQERAAAACLRAWHALCCARAACLAARAHRAWRGWLLAVSWGRLARRDAALHCRSRRLRGTLRAWRQAALQQGAEGLVRELHLEEQVAGHVRAARLRRLLRAWRRAVVDARHAAVLAERQAVTWSKVQGWLQGDLRGSGLLPPPAGAGGGDPGVATPAAPGAPAQLAAKERSESWLQLGGEAQRAAVAADELQGGAAPPLLADGVSIRTLPPLPPLVLPPGALGVSGRRTIAISLPGTAAAARADSSAPEEPADSAAAALARRERLQRFVSEAAPPPLLSRLP